jgi:phosphate-selective porin OprO/OprP
MRNFNLRKLAPALLALSALPLSARADELAQLHAQIKLLEKKLLVLERKQELQDERIAITDRGATLSSADGANSLRLRGLVQFDSRVFFSDGGLSNNAFVLRRARLIAEGSFARNFSFQLVPEFGGGSPALVDANIGWTVAPALQFKLGRFKAPVGLELLQSDSWTFFNERSIVTNLVPNRDLGVTVSVDVLAGKLNCTIGLLGGVADGASTTNSDFDNEKDFVGRLWATPFKDAAGSALQGLSFGVSGTYGREKGTAGRTSGYRTDGQQIFFSYLGTTITDGPNWRISPQLDYRNGSFGLQGEYVISTVNVRAAPNAHLAELQAKAWQLSAGYVLTGEASSFAGIVPAADFSLGKGTWGAFEVAARYARLRVDDAAFPLYASPAASAAGASSVGLGLNWYLSKAVRFTFDCYHTSFDRAPGTPATPANAGIRQDEKSLITRFQLTF